MNTVTSRNLKAEMVRYGLKITDLAEILGVSAVSVSNKLTGKTSWTLGEAKQVVDLINSMGGDYTVESLFLPVHPVSETHAR